MVVLLEVEGHAKDHAVSCMDFVRKLTVSSISLGGFRLKLKFILFSREDLKVVQSIEPWFRVGLFGLFGGMVSIARSTDE